MVLVLSQSRRTHSLLDSTASIEIACDFALYSLSLGLEFGGGTLEENSSLQRKVPYETWCMEMKEISSDSSTPQPNALA